MSKKKSYHQPNRPSEGSGGNDRGRPSFTLGQPRQVYIRIGNQTLFSQAHCVTTGSGRVHLVGELAEGSSNPDVRGPVWQYNGSSDAVGLHNSAPLVELERAYSHGEPPYEGIRSLVHRLNKSARKSLGSNS